MVTRNWHGLRLRSWRMRLHRALDRLRILPDKRALHRTRFVGTLLLVGGGLVLLLIFPAIREALLIWTAGAALALFLQEVVDPTPLFWTVPWEVMQLLS